MMTEKFTGSFTQQEAIPEEAIDAAVAVLRSGRLHRYNQLHDESSEVALLEQEYSNWQGSAYCLALTSGGQALQIALRACGVTAGDTVLTNAFTLAPVPGAIAALNARAMLVEVDSTLRLDLEDLKRKIDTSKAKYLLLSHMRGHLCDMQQLMSLCNESEIIVIEDCAHTMGALWNGKRSGNFGKVACFSTQSYKHLNTGEGGLLTTDDADIAARAILLSGSYMLYARHSAKPPENHFGDVRYTTPNLSCRMDNLRAAILRPQLKLLEGNIARWNKCYQLVEHGLKKHAHITTIQRPLAETHVGSSIQFRLNTLTTNQCQAFLAAAANRGIDLKWFGRAEPTGFTSSHHHWHYMRHQKLPHTDQIMATLFDMRLPLTFSEQDCTTIARLICEAITEII